MAALDQEAAGDPRVLLAGYVFGEELDELYTNAAAFVLPSFLEGLPLTLLEAASYGTPIVASDIPPHLEVVGAGRAGPPVFLSAATRRRSRRPCAARAPRGGSSARARPCSEDEVLAALR